MESLLKVKLLKAKTVADVLDLGPSKVYQLAHSGELAAVFISQGNRKACMRFRPEAVEQFI